jgi:uncharacterized protein (DUF488 family)
VRRLYTIGHSNRTLDELVATLVAWEIDVLVDIRHFTRSRANPQFNAASLRRRLARHGIDYVWLEALGGRRGKQRDIDPARNAGWQVAAFHNYADYAEGPEFAAGLRELLRLTRGHTPAIMCAEAVWWRCHRRIVTDYAITAGVRVDHIFTATKAERAKRTAFAVVDRKTHTLRYPQKLPRRRSSAKQ